jgi:hypothetical protein
MTRTSRNARAPRGPGALLGVLIGAVALLSATVPASALAGPELQVDSTHYPATVPAGTYASYELVVKNKGDAASTDPITVELTVPAGLEVTSVSAPKLFDIVDSWTCSMPDSQTASCTGPFAEINAEPQPGEEACVSNFFGFVTCRITVTVKADENAPAGTVTPAIKASGGTWAGFNGVDPIEIGPPAEFRFASFDGGVFDGIGDPVTQAGSHPDTASTEFFFSTVLAANGTEYPTGFLRDTVVRIPPGLVGNPQAVPTACTQAQLNTGVGGGGSCPPESQVGTATIWISGGQNEATPGNPVLFSTLPVSRMETPEGLPALFAFNVSGAAVQVYPRVRTGDDYGITVINKNAGQTLVIAGVTFEFWGTPADHGTGAPTAPFLSLPTSCTGPVETFIDAISWYGESASSSFITAPGGTGCPAVPFGPSIEARPTTNAGDQPSGLDVDLEVPQNNDPDGIATAHLKDTTVTLPEGLVVNPSGANGLDGCSLGEFGYTSTDPDGTVHTTPDPATCPDAARVATVEVDSPLVDHPMLGSAYIADPYQNPFNSLLALYITLNDRQTGIVVKLAGKVDANPSTGQLTATFENNPQLPFEHFKLHFKGGAHGTLRTPSTCGVHTTEATLNPWSSTGGGTAVDLTDPWSIDQSCSNSEGEMPNSPDIDAGSVSPIAATASPTAITLRRNDGSQEFSKVTLKLPPGLTGKLVGVAQCSDAALASAASKSGNEEKASPSCPASSRIGAVDVAAGAGPAPYHTQGTAYLAGPYKGAPLSMAIVTPATAGPFDLGTVLVRVALFVDRNTAQITAVSDQIPSILQGIPLDVRSARVLLDRPDFTRNGTSCDSSSFEGTLVSTLGQPASLSERFQLGECSALPFKPKLAIRLFGGTKRGAHPALRATLQMPPGGANIARASVALPRSEFLDQGHIGTVCTRVQFAAKECPAASVYGHVVATSPLVDYALEGSAYLRSSDNELPDLVMALHGPPGQPIEVDAVGRIDSVKGGIRTTFEGTPDIPVSTLVLNMAGGKKGLLQNSTNICKGKHKATVEFDGHNGKALDFKTLLKNGKCGKAKKRRAAKRKTARRNAR